MAAFEIYYDESMRKRRLTLAGFVAATNDWADFSTRWKAMLLKYRISHFHTKTFRNKQSLLYKHLSRTERRDLLAEIIGLIKNHLLFGAGITVDVDTFNTIISAVDRSSFGSAYAVCALLCTVNVAGRALTGSGKTEHMSVLIEDGHANAEDAVKILNLYKRVTAPVDFGKYTRLYGGGDALRNAPLKLDTIGLSSKLQTPAVQAGDLLAYSLAAPERVFSESVGRSITAKIPVLSVALETKDIQEYKARSADFVREDSRLMKQRQGQKKTLRALGLPFSELNDILEIEFPDVATEEEIQHVLRRLRAID